MKEEVVQVHFAMPIAKTHETLQKHFRNKPLKTVIDFRCRKEGRKEGSNEDREKQRKNERKRVSISCRVVASHYIITQ